MMLRKCKVCKSYSLEERHCGNATGSAHPPRFNMNDKYAKYRRKEKGLE